MVVFPFYSSCYLFINPFILCVHLFFGVHMKFREQFIRILEINFVFQYVGPRVWLPLLILSVDSFAYWAIAHLR